MSWPQRRTRGRRSSYGRVLGVEDGGYMEAPGTIVGEIVDERPTQDLPPGLSPLGYIVQQVEDARR